MLKNLSAVFLFCTAFLFVIAVLTGCSSGDKKLAGAGKDWPVYLGGIFSSHYSKLSQISIDNIDQYVAFTLKSSK
jgi:glucose dehydrogenase